MEEYLIPHNLILNVALHIQFNQSEIQTLTFAKCHNLPPCPPPPPPQPPRPPPRPPPQPPPPGANSIHILAFHKHQMCLAQGQLKCF